VDWKDRNTCVLFGDGAGAAVCRIAPAHGLLTAVMGADGRKADLITWPAAAAVPGDGGVGRLGMHYLRMEGRNLPRRRAGDENCRQEALRRCEIDISRIKCIIPTRQPSHHRCRPRTPRRQTRKLCSTPQIRKHLRRFRGIALDEAVASGSSACDLILMGFWRGAHMGRGGN